MPITEQIQGSAGESEVNLFNIKAGRNLSINLVLISAHFVELGTEAHRGAAGLASGLHQSGFPMLPAEGQALCYSAPSAKGG